jgi:hypothetical protein
MVKLHTRLIKALQVTNRYFEISTLFIVYCLSFSRVFEKCFRTTNLWTQTIDEAFIVEDILTNETNTNRTFVRSAPYNMNQIEKAICNPTLGTLKS